MAPLESDIQISCDDSHHHQRMILYLKLIFSRFVVIDAVGRVLGNGGFGKVFDAVDK